MLSGFDTSYIFAQISQRDFVDVEHANGTVHTAMRNGNSVMMRIQQ
jgi:hypothetical protein